MRGVFGTPETTLGATAQTLGALTLSSVLQTQGGILGITSRINLIGLV
jgi:hypothetical protein